VNGKRVEGLISEIIHCACASAGLLSLPTPIMLDVPNLARDMVLTGMDQLWRADITYA